MCYTVSCHCHDNSYVAGPILIKNKITDFILIHNTCVACNLFRKTAQFPCAAHNCPEKHIGTIAFPSLPEDFLSLIILLLMRTNKPMTMDLLSSLGEQRRLLSDWLNCYPGTQTLFKHMLLKSLKTKMAFERAISSWLHIIACSRVLGKCCSFLLCLLFRMAAKGRAGKLKLYTSYHFHLLQSNCFPCGFL